MPSPPSQLELLAPAGSLEAFLAAMESGADAVYCGLRDFSARAKAKNFTLADLEKMVSFARHKGRKVYVTLNTLIKERELPKLAETLGNLEALGIDGIILQDLAVWRLAKRHFPGLALHASTQMTVHNAAGVRMLERMGFTRAVLARELTIPEIAAIRRSTTMELEHFIHGALCFSFSGQCYFSSWLGGKSGNRGRCAQPCRRRYRYRQSEGYYFSTNDLSAIDLLPMMAEAGVMSFKIEGRMKSAEYVANVVSAYRMALDAPPASRAEAVRRAKELLRQSFGRVPTRGFLTGSSPSDISIPSLKGATGLFLGEVLSSKGGEISFRSKEKLHVGDRLRVQPRSDQAGTAFTIKDLRLGKRSVKTTPAGSQVNVPTPFPDLFRRGDSVFKVSSEQAFTLSEAACRRRLESVPPASAPVRITVGIEEHRLLVRGVCSGIVLERSYPVEMYPAESSPLTEDTLHTVFSRSAGEPFTLAELRAESLPAVVIPPSRMKEIRRDYFRALSERLAEERNEGRRTRVQSALGDLLPYRPRPAAEQHLEVGVKDLREVRLLSDSVVDRVVIPLSPGSLTRLSQAGKLLKGRESRVVWDIPFILLDEQWKDYRKVVRELTKEGFSTFRLNNLGHFPLFDDLAGVRLVAGYRLFSLNSQAILGWRELGASEVTLYVEDDRENLREVLARETGLDSSAVVYGSIPLIVSRIAIRQVRSDSPVLSDRGEAYRVESRSGLTTLTSETDFSLVGKVEELRQMGCGRYLLDISHMGAFSPGGRQVLEAWKRRSNLPGTSPFNYEAGME